MPFLWLLLAVANGVVLKAMGFSSLMIFVLGGAVFCVEVLGVAFVYRAKTPTAAGKDGTGVEAAVLEEGTAKGPPPDFGEGLKGMDFEAALRLLYWFGVVDDPNIHAEMVAVIATKLSKGFLVMPVESAKPSADLLLGITARISLSDPATLSAISFLRRLLAVSPQKIRAEIHGLASDAIAKAREDDFLQAVFLPSYALKTAGDFLQAVRRTTGLEYHQIGVVEKALAAKHYRHSADDRLHDSTITNFEVIEMVASLALTLATSILIDGAPKE